MKTEKPLQHRGITVENDKLNTVAWKKTGVNLIFLLMSYLELI